MRVCCREDEVGRKKAMFEVSIENQIIVLCFVIVSLKKLHHLNLKAQFIGFIKSSYTDLILLIIGITGIGFCYQRIFRFARSKYCFRKHCFSNVPSDLLPFSLCKINTCQSSLIYIRLRCVMLLRS